MKPFAGVMALTCALSAATAVLAAEPMIYQGTITLPTGVSAQGNIIVTPSSPLPVAPQAGSAIIGKVGIDQTTPGTTNGVVATGNAAAPTNASSLSSFNLRTFSATGLASGGAINPATDISGAAVNGTGTFSVANAATSAAGAAVANTATAAVASSQVLKASAGNGYRYAATAGASAGFLLVFDATSAPADGAVTPKICRAVAANTSLEVDHSNMPDRYATGITEVFSTTGCYTKTASATAALEGQAQ